MLSKHSLSMKACLRPFQSICNMNSWKSILDTKSTTLKSSHRTTIPLPQGTCKQHSLSRSARGSEGGFSVGLSHYQAQPLFEGALGCNFMNILLPNFGPCPARSANSMACYAQQGDLRAAFVMRASHQQAQLLGALEV